MTGTTIDEIDDLEKECQYCYCEIDNSGLEGFRCTNRTAIKARDSSWCYPKNANEPCSICEYCEPKQNTGMTIDEAISHLGTYSSTMGSGQTTQAQHEESKRVSIDTMRKYQKLKQTLDIIFALGDENPRRTVKISELREALEDGND